MGESLGIQFSIYWAKKKAPVCVCCEQMIIGDIFSPVLSIKGEQETEANKSSIQVCSTCYAEIKKHEAKQQ